MLFKRVKKEGSLTGKGNEIDHCDCFNNKKKIKNKCPFAFSRKIVANVAI